ncbi:MAG: hypothetical protein LBB88_05615 [Planctomycetaceae bacterium]|jgi:hypothetical protein|nr:hypothetical protein [Planctomycetaceae bacterium]
MVTIKINSDLPSATADATTLSGYDIFKKHIIFLGDIGDKGDLGDIGDILVLNLGLMTLGNKTEKISFKKLKAVVFC